MVVVSHVRPCVCERLTCTPNPSMEMPLDTLVIARAAFYRQPPPIVPYTVDDAVKVSLTVVSDRPYVEYL